MTHSYAFLRLAAEQFKRLEPERWRVAYPRRIATPHGYPNPANSAVLRYSHLLYGQLASSEVNKTMRDCAIIAWKMAHLGCPTFFICQELIEDLVDTEPPMEMELSELRWPFDAMMFVLPEEFHSSYFPRPVPFITVSRQLEEAAAIQAPPEVLREFPRQHLVYYPPTGGKGAFYMNAMAMFGDKPYDYSSAYPMTSQVKKLLTDTAFAENDPIEQTKAVELKIDPTTLTSKEEDLDLIHKASGVAIWVMLAMMARPHFLEQTAKAQRPIKVKHGNVTKEELWSPDFIGKTYVRSTPQGGHHASPKLHRRRGHMRMQRFGPKLGQSKLIWIEHTWVGG